MCGRGGGGGQIWAKMTLRNLLVTKKKACTMTKHFFQVLLSHQSTDEANLLSSSPEDLSQFCDLIQTLVPTGLVQIQIAQETDVSELQVKARHEKFT